MTTDDVVMELTKAIKALTKEVAFLKEAVNRWFDEEEG